MARGFLVTAFGFGEGDTNMPEKTLLGDDILKIQFMAE